MTEHSAVLAPVQQRTSRRPRLAVLLLALAILTASPFAAVACLDMVARARFLELRSTMGAVRPADAMYDAFQHSYAAGVTAVVFGDTPAMAAGYAVELIEMNKCRERVHDLMNNAGGRQLAMNIHDVGPEGWRDRFAAELFTRLLQGDEAFSIRFWKDPRTRAACYSD